MRIGCDLVHIPRFDSLIEKHSFVSRVYHPAEIEYCEGRANKASSYAARFAAKEAFVKALGTGLYSHGVVPKDIWITHDNNMRPILNLSEHVKQIMRAFGYTSVDVSLSHQIDYAIATVILF